MWVRHVRLKHGVVGGEVENGEDELRGEESLEEAGGDDDVEGCGVEGFWRRGCGGWGGRRAVGGA